MIMRKCKKCGDEIPLERLDVLPKTKKCIKCTKEKPYREFNYTGMIIDMGNYLDRKPLSVDEISSIDPTKLFN